MRAVWYETTGAAHQVLRVGELPDPHPGPGEVLVRLHRSGINPGDTKKRTDRFGYGMVAPLVVPHSDGAGVVEAVGEGVDAARRGRRVWVWGAQSGRAMGTAAELVAVPSALAVDLPDEVDDDLAACLGIPGTTAHRCLFADGPVTGRTVLVHGVLGGVGTMAAGLACWGGARVVGTVRRSTDLDEARRVVEQAVALDDDPATALRELAPGGFERVVEVDLAGNAALDQLVLAPAGTIACYATGTDPAPLPFWELLFLNATLRLVGSDDLDADARRQALEELTAAAAAGALRPRIADPLPLGQCARAHDLVDAGSRERILLDVRR